MTSNDSNSSSSTWIGDGDGDRGREEKGDFKEAIKYISEQRLQKIYMPLRTKLA